MKIEKDIHKPSRPWHKNRVWIGYFAEDSDGCMGVSSDSAHRAVLDCRDEHRMNKRMGQQPTYD